MHKGFGVIVSVILLSCLPVQITFCDYGWAQTATDRKAEADKLNQKGIQQFDKGQLKDALEIFLQVLAIRQQIKDGSGEGKALNNIGLVYDTLGQYPKALEYYQFALTIFKQVGDRKGEGSLLENLGNVYYRLGEFKKAIESHQQALAISKQIGASACTLDSKSVTCLDARNGEGNALGNLGNAYNSLGQYPKAIEFYQQSLVIEKEISDRRGEGSLLGNLGVAYRSLGQYQKAIEFLQQALAIFRQIGDRNGEGDALINLGSTYNNLAQYQRAIELYQQALAIKKEIGDRNGEGISLGNLGNAYKSLGQYPKAIEFYQQALAIEREISDRNGEGNSLANLGNTYSSLGQDQKAIELLQQALAIFKQLGDREGEGSALINLGNAYNNLGQYKKTIPFHQQALAIFKQIGDRNGEGISFTNLGSAYNNLGQYQKAIEFYQQALAIFKQVGDRENEGSSLNYLGNTLNTLRHTALSIFFLKQSVNVRETIRQDIRELSRQDQQSYTKTIANGYRTLANLLLKQGRVTEALQVLDLLKIQELEDYLKNVKGNDRTAQGIQLLAPEQAINSQLSTTSSDRLPELNRQLASQIQQLPKSAVNKVPEYLQKLPQGAVLIYPLILDDRLELIVFSPNTIPINRTVPIKKANLEKLITDFRSDLQDPTSQDVRTSSKKLYDLLIKPIAADLKQANATTILYAPDGILRYIPLAALYDGNQWLVEQYRINNLIAYSLFDADSNPHSNLNIFAGAFGSEPRSGFSGLPATIPEVNHISTSFSHTTQLIGQDFTAASTKAKVAGQAIVHLATHAEFNSDSPFNSFVLFGDGSKVTLAEINEWQLKDTDLVILSACRTGVGSLGNGTEILGFGYQVQRAGAKAAIASLWTVSDGGTQKLMEAFYGSLKKGNVSLSTSLQEAQLNMIRKPVKQGEINFNHPYFWSAFVLIGNGL
jgi:CHAT domain-containing protein/Tfp pilus assembly protein PilF